MSTHPKPQLLALLSLPNVGGEYENKTLATHAPFEKRSKIGRLLQSRFPDEIRHSIRLSKPSIVIASPTAYETIAELSSDYPFIRKIIVFGDHIYDKSNVINYHSLVNDKKVRGSVLIAEQ